MRKVEDYLSDNNTIAAIIDKLFNMNVAKMSEDRGAGKNIKNIIDGDSRFSVVSIEKLDKDRASDLTYIELLTLIWASRSDSKYRFLYSDSDKIVSSEENYNYFVYSIMLYFLKKAENNRTIDTFLKLKLADIYNYFSLDLLPGYHSPFAMLCNKYRDYIKEFKYDKTEVLVHDIEKETTVIEFLRSCYAFSHLHWIPSVNDPDRYIYGVNRAYEIAGDFLIADFVWYYDVKKGYDASYVKAKYRQVQNNSEWIDLPGFLLDEEDLPFN